MCTMGGTHAAAGCPPLLLAHLLRRHAFQQLPVLSVYCSSITLFRHGRAPQGPCWHRFVRKCHPPPSCLRRPCRCCRRWSLCRKLSGCWPRGRSSCRLLLLLLLLLLLPTQRKLQGEAAES